MPYTRQQGIEFWYRFDNATLFRRTPAINAALSAAYFSLGKDLDTPVDEFRASFVRADHPAQFANDIAPGRAGFAELARLQQALFQNNFGSDLDAMESAFAEFGQGVLFDPRPPRPVGRKIHMMDGDVTDWVGWHRWFAFIRAAQLSGADGAFWEHVARCLGLAWAIQSETRPRLDVPDNPGMAPDRLQLLHAHWSWLSVAALDWAFANHPGAAPLPEDFPAPLQSAAAALAAPVAVATYAEIQTLLEVAAGQRSRPIHGGQARFWQLPHAQFITASIYGVGLIAPPGADRGERSPLVKVLRGTQPDFPRMPLNRPPMPDSEIAAIARWIDAGLPQ